MRRFNINKAKRFRFPIVMHIYAAFLIIIFAIGFLYIRYFSRDVNVFIRAQCTDKIDTTIEMTEDMLVEFGKFFSVPSDDSIVDFTESSVWETLSYTTMANDVSIAVLNLNDNNKFDLLWPTDKSMTKVAMQYVNSISNDYIVDSQEIGMNKDSSTDLFYYKLRSVKIDYSAAGNQENNHIFVLYYIPADNFKYFATILFETLFRTTLIAILGTGFLCILISMPLIISIYKMVRFSKRIANGDFRNYHSFVVSRELLDLSDGMNFMADRLRENDKEQKQFFQNVSHELRTPLQSIQGYAEGLKYDVFVDDDKDTAINVIINESERLSSMVENILSISKMDMAKNGNYEVKKTNISINELIGHEIENIRGNILLNKKDLIQKSDVGDKLIYANEGDILRMLDNIFSNCIRYAKQNIYFYTTIENDYVNFTIYDDGDGFTDEVLANMFTRFAKGSDGKHGIGLSLVKAIAEEHKGSIEAYNKDGFGACFEIRIPCESPNSQMTNTNKNK